MSALHFPACLILQPIHNAGVSLLQEAGLTPVNTIDGIDPLRVVAAITRNAGFSRSQMDALPNLLAIAVHGVGYDPVDISAASSLGIAVTNTPGTNQRSVAEHAIGLMFALAKQIVGADAALRAGDQDFKYSTSFLELAGLTLGILGFGGIGQQTASLGLALGMNVIAHSEHQSDAVFHRLGVARVSSVDVLLQESDVVSLHLPLNATSRNLIERKRLSLMKPSALLINTGRGGTVDEDALVEALQSGRLRGAGLDVFQSEPLAPSNPLCSLKNVVLSPHLAGSTEAALSRTAAAAVSCVLEVLSGRRPATLLNPHVWPSRRLPAENS